VESFQIVETLKSVRPTDETDAYFEWYFDMWSLVVLQFADALPDGDRQSFLDAVGYSVVS
jgi:hypothetical protein